jgi:hypothetical protein
VWSVYRLLTRSLLWQFTVADFCWVVAVSGTAVGDAPSAFHNASASGVIALVAVATFALQSRPAISLPMTLAIAAACVWGAVQSFHWTAVGQVVDILYLFVASVGAALIRLMIGRIADAVDQARADRQAAEVGRSVSAARRHFDREQLALLHDTAAATLLMVGQQAAVAPDRLAAQAARDLNVLQRPWPAPVTRIDLVDALRADAVHLQTPVSFTGHEAVWLGGRMANAVTAAAREVMTNIERHASATHIGIDVRPGTVVITDNGVGFTVGDEGGGQGIRASVVGRMSRVGGTGSVQSSPTQGTVAELSWAHPAPLAAPEDFDGEMDRSIGRIRAGFTLAMAGYAIVALFANMAAIGGYSSHATVQNSLIVLAGLCALSALPAVWWSERRPAWTAAVVLAVIAVLQPALLSVDELGSDANWAQDTIGFCLLPLLLRWPTARAEITLTACWAVPAAVALLRNPTEPMVVSLVFSLAGSLIPQLFASLFSTWAFQAAREARTENDALIAVITAEEIAEAIQSDYVKRYADIMAHVVPMLSSLGAAEPVTPDLRRRARAESRRLRTLFDQLRADHSLSFELRAVVESAEDRGVEVAVHFDSELPELEQTEVDDIVRLTERLLALATTTARVIVTGTDEEIELSIVCEVAPEHVDYQLDVDADTDLVWSDTTAWLTKRHRPTRTSAFAEDPDSP